METPSDIGHQVFPLDHDSSECNPPSEEYPGHGRHQSSAAAGTNLTRADCDTLHPSRSHLHRRVKQTARADQQIPIPPGRIIIDINLNDEAFDHSYAALSTLSDPSQGIDAGKGLFAKRDFSPNSPLDDWDLIGYYVGCKPLMVEEVKQHIYDPDPSINTGFVIQFGGLAADGWNHEQCTYTCAPVLIKILSTTPNTTAAGIKNGARIAMVDL